MIKHENCGGELKKIGKIGNYRCQACRKLVKLGTRGRAAFGPGYIKRQLAKA